VSSTAPVHAGTPAAPLPTVYKLPASAVASHTGDGKRVLSPAGAASVLREVNVARTNLAGINRRPLPAGHVEVNSGGGLTLKANDGRRFEVRSNGTLASYAKGDHTAAFRSDGRIRSVHTQTMDIARSTRGQRTIVMRRADHTVVVSTGRQSGYVQRSVVLGGRSLIQRTYVMGPAVYSRVYSVYSYHGLWLADYVPAVYFSPEFYGWAYYPWPQPVAYAWGWETEPWYGYYGPYFTVAPAYRVPSFWLAEYVVARTLAETYQMYRQSQQPGDPAEAGQEMEDQQAPSDQAVAESSAPITPELKQTIAEEVQQQLAYENAASARPSPEDASSVDSLPQIMTPNHLFVTAAPLSVMVADGRSCDLSGGDVLRLVTAPAADARAAQLAVVASRQGDCPAGLQVTVGFEDLQEMQNSFRAKLDSGLQTLRDHQGGGGLPAAPPSAMAQAPRPAAAVPADSTDVAGVLDSAQQQADQTESQIGQEALAAPAASVSAPGQSNSPPQTVPPPPKPASEGANALQPIATPPKPAGEGPSLEVTMKFIQDKLSEMGPITYSENSRFTDENSGVPPWTTTWTDELTKVVADLQQCSISYHCQTSSDDKSIKPSNYDVFIELKEVKKITVRPLAEQLNESFAGKLTVTIHSPIFQVAVLGRPKGSGAIIMDDEELANRLARAFSHAVELCTPDKKPEPF
jgi:hypothetical protein